MLLYISTQMILGVEFYILETYTFCIKVGKLELDKVILGLGIK